MSEFWVYLELGFSHITDLNGYDHILFIIALCAVYKPKQIKELLILVTAFTLGHSLTLALAALKWISYDTGLIEFLIPVTILITSFLNMRKEKRQIFTKKSSGTNIRYILAAGFGLIHGMGFSSYLASLLGKEQNLLIPLFSFNLGLEIGQILIVLVFMGIAFVFLYLFRTTKRDWKLVVSGATMGISLVLAMEKLAELLA